MTEHRPALHLPGKRQRQAWAHQTSKPDDTCRSGDGGCFILKPRKKPGVFPVTSDQVKNLSLHFFFCTLKCKLVNCQKRPEPDQR